MMQEGSVVAQMSLWMFRVPSNTVLRKVVPKSTPPQAPKLKIECLLVVVVVFFVVFSLLKLLSLTPYIDQVIF